MSVLQGEAYILCTLLGIRQFAPFDILNLMKLFPWVTLPKK